MPGIVATTYNSIAPTLETIAFTTAPTAGSWTISFNGQTTGTLAYNATAAQVATALDALSSIAGQGGAVSVTTVGNAYTYELIFGGNLAGTTLSPTFATASLTPNAQPTLSTASSGSAQSFELIAFPAAPTAGSWTISFGGQTTGSLSPTAGAAAVTTALDALSSIGGAGGSVSVTTLLNAYTYQLTFGGSLAGTTLLPTVTTTALSPSAQPTVSTAKYNYNLSGAFDSPSAAPTTTLVKSGGGSLTLAGANNADDNAIQVNGGNLIATSTTALGPAGNAVSVAGGSALIFQSATGMSYANAVSVSLSGGSSLIGTVTGTAAGTLSVPASLTLTGNATVQSSLAATSLAISGSVALGGNQLSLLGAGNTLLGGTISGTPASSLVKGAGVNDGTDGGSLTLSGVNTNYQGATTINDGLLIVGANNALGNGANATYLAQGTALEFPGGVNYTTPEQIIVGGNGTGYTANGTTFNLGSVGSNSFAGTISTTSNIPLTLASFPSLGPTDTFTLSGGIANGGVLTLAGGASFALAGQIGNGGSGGSTSLSVQDGGTATLSGADNEYSGGTTAGSGTLVFADNNSGGGLADGTGNMVVDSGATVTVNAQAQLGNGSVTVQGANGAVPAAVLNLNGTSGTGALSDGGTVNVGVGGQGNWASTTVAGGATLSVAGTMGSGAIDDSARWRAPRAARSTAPRSPSSTGPRARCWGRSAAAWGAR